MKQKNLILLFTFIVFLLMAGTGVLMYFSFNKSSLHLVLGMKKNTWLNIHMIAAALTSVFVFYHVAMRWEWIENVVFGKAKQKYTRTIWWKRWVNTLLMIFFSLSFTSGFLNFLLEGECLICEDYHGLIGLLLILLFVFHSFHHSFPSKKYFK